MKNIYHKIISSALIAACAVLLTCGDQDDHPGMVWIPPTGSDGFMMGSPVGEPGRASGNTETRHKVTLTQGFWMSRYEITQEQFFLIMNKGPAIPSYGERRPAEGVNWYDAIVFCNRLSIEEGLVPVYSMQKSEGTEWSANPTDWGEIPFGAIDSRWDAVTPNWSANGYRLPTEAEWEYACRAGTTTAYNTGDSINTSQANCDGRDDDPPGDYKEHTTPVGSYAPNTWGLYDMHGNVYEWCWDWHNVNYYSDPNASKDPSGPFYGSTSPYMRVHRGGSWDSGAADLRSASRSGSGPNIRYYFLGFRVVRQ